MSKNGYINFPLHFLTGLLEDPQREATRIIDYGIISFINQQPKMGLGELVKKVLFMYYNNKPFLVDDVEEQLDVFYGEEENPDSSYHGRFDFDENYNGFTNDEGKFLPTELDEMVKIIENDNQLERLFRKNERLFTYNYAQHFLKFSGGDLQDTENSYNDLRNKIDFFERIYGTDAYASVKLSLLFEVFKGRFPLHEFLFLSAAKSIIGKRNFNATNKNIVVMRACGAKNKEVFNQIKKNPKVHEFCEQYSKRFQFDKIMNSLTRKKQLVKISDYRHIYLSSSLDHEELLIRISERKREYKKPISDEREAGRKLRDQIRGSND
ncbi:hypothetical protein [uncultured Draconibacterium sp.]|uniref:hypothetical protein n=1 Tax=uncultured Draconibacterium sp. TaxID=1573823 RepID=UPI0025D186F8|nr:hypothetical protein [uncultured Draconibacterium sp.]